MNKNDQKLVAHKNTKTTDLNKLNQGATCLQISQQGGRVDQWPSAERLTNCQLDVLSTHRHLA